MTTDAEEFVILILFVFGAAATGFGLGSVVERERLCENMGAEYRKGKCVIVERKEAKP